MEIKEAIAEAKVICMQKFINRLLLAIFSLPTFIFGHSSFEDADVHVYYDHDEANFAVPPPQLPSHEDAMMLFVSGSYTLWRPYQQGMALLYTVSDQASPTNWIYPRMNYQSGFKVALGVNTFHDGWKVEAEYTWFYNHPKANTPKLNLAQVQYYAFWIDNVVTDATTDFSSRFANSFNRIDLTVDRAFYAGNYFTFAPWIGLVSAWENQTFYQEILTNVPDYFEFNQTQNWWGIGPYLGADCTYYFLDYFGIFLTGGGSLNLCEHKVSQYRTKDSQIDVNTSLQLWNVEPMADLMIGLRFNSYGMDFGMQIEAGWQLQVWFEHNGFILYPITPNFFGNYSMQGLTATLRLNF